MNKWKFLFFICLTLSLFLLGIQYVNILDLKSKNENYANLIVAIDQDLAAIAKGNLSKFKEDDILCNLIQTDSNLILTEYDLGNVKMRGLEFGFDRHGNLKNISTMFYPLSRNKGDAGPTYKCNK